VIALLLPSLYIANIAQKKKAKVQIAIILDTSNSMDGLIDQAKSQLWKIVNELAVAKYNGEAPDLEIALYEYGNDHLLAKEDFVRLLSNLTADLDKISEDLFALKTYGGEEYCGAVIVKATKQLLWSSSNEDLKLIFIAGNEPFTQGGTNYVEACKDAIAKGIIVNTIFCGSSEEGIATKWKDGADLADGKYFNIDQNQQTVYIESPYDADITKYNNELNKTYVAYGEEGTEMKKRQSVQDENAASFNQEVVIQRAVSKSSGMYKNSTWDLVDAVKEDKVDLEKLDDNELPAELKGKSKEEIQKYVDEKQKQREELQEKIADLDAKRKVYVAEKQRELAGDNSLETALIKAIREQAQQKGFTFETK